MEPSGSASCNEVSENGCSEEVRDREEPNKYTSLQPAPGVDRVE